VRSQLAAGLAVLAGVGTTPGGTLTGTVNRGPITPVCKTGTPCSAPARGLVLVFRRTGASARTRTDAAGRYRIALAPGAWRVSLTRSGLGTAIEPATLHVVAGRTRHVDLSIDTGIR
jgi:hypothetical protein